MSVCVVTDSGCDLTPEAASALKVEVVPVRIFFGTEKFRDGIDIDRATFYRRMNGGDVPKTEPPSVQDYATVFDRLLANGNEIVCITLSSEISQSYAHALEAATAAQGPVYVVDSRGASGMQLLLARFAVERAAKGDDGSAIARALVPGALKTAVYFAVPDIGHLGRSGRLPKAVVALGSMLNVSLVLRMNENGVIGPAGQSRSFDRTIEIMAEAAVRAIGRTPNAHIAISHVEAAETAERLREGVRAKLGAPPAFETVNVASLTIAAHMGTGAVGIFAIVP